MKRFLSLLLILTLCMQMMVVSTAAADTTSADTTSADTSDIKTLSFQPFDSVSNSDGTVIYMTSRSEKRVYSINTYNFTVSFITFDLMPEALCYKDGKLYVALCTRDHYSCWWKEDQSGAFAIIDCSTFTKTAQYNINIDPYDIAVSNENNIYITCGSGQFGYIGGYTQQGVLINTSSICQLSTLVYNSTLDRLYTIDDMVMPLDMTAYTLDSTGKITSSYVWKYHNDFDTSNLFDISPDGKYIFNNIGYIATCAAAQSEDMIKRDEPFVPFNGISFDLANDAFYLAGIDNRVHQYQYSNLTPTKDYAVSSGIPQSVYKTLDGIVIITKDNNSVYRIEKATTTVSSATDNDYGAAFKNEFSAFVYDPGHNKTYLLNKGTKKLFVFNDSTGTIEKAVSLDYRPDGINISSDGTKILIVNDNRVYLVTELDINTLQKTREIIYSIPENLNETCHRHIIEGQGKIFIIDGDIEIHAYVFDQNTLAYLGNFGLPTGISDIKIDDSGKYMYISTQQSWLINMDDSNYSLIYKYDITKDAAVLTDCFNPSNYTVSCGPVDSPIILCKDSLYFKKLKFSASDLKTNNILFPETIYAINEAAGQVVGRNGIYDLNTGTLLQKVNFTNSKVIEFDKDGNLYFSKDNSFIQYKPTGIKITVSKPCMKVGESQGLTVTATYSDGTEIDVTASSKLTSSNQSVASVATGGKLNALSGGTSVITASFADLTATCNIDVGAYVNLISVSGYDIGFSTDKTEYSVVVPDSTTVPPSVTYTAEQGMNVKVTPASAVPGTTTVTVSDSEGLRTKTYHINFVSKSDDIADKMPYQIVVDGGKPANGTYNLNINIKDNPNYSGPAYAKFTLIVQRFNKYLELEQVDCYSSNQVSYPLSDDELVDIMVVDCFQKPNYVSVPLALPITFGLEQ